jgi:DNA polymerase-1
MPEESAITRFSSEVPCPICGGHPTDPRGNGTRCFGFFSEGGLFAHCTREEAAGDAEYHEGSSTYSHLMGGECRCGSRHGDDQGNGYQKIVAAYDYVLLNGDLAHQTVRCEPKGFSQRRPDGDGGWIYKGVFDNFEPVLYRLPDIYDAISKIELVLVCEGEKDADRGAALGFCTTTCAMGAKKWRPSYTQALRGAHVVLLPHNDKAGREHVLSVADELVGAASSLKVVELPGVPEDGGDLSDWIDAGGTEEDLEDLINRTEYYSSQTFTYKSGSGTNIDLPFKTGLEIADSTPLVTEWIAYPWFPKGTIIEVSGKIKIAGKTTWIAHAVSKILRGEPFMGGHTKKTKVLFLTEQSPNSFRKVLKNASLERDDIKVLYWHEVRAFSWEELIAGVRAEANPFGAGVIVIDVISRWASFNGVSEKDASYADLAVPPLKELVADGFTVIYARHDRKSGGDVGESGRGTSQLGGDVDQMFQLARPQGANNAPNVRVLTNTGRFTEDTPQSVNIELKSGEYHLLGSGKDFAKQNALQVIPDVLPATREAAIKPAEIVDRVSAHGVSRRACYEALKDLAEAGVIEEVGGAGTKGDPRRFYRPVVGEGKGPENGAEEDSSQTPTMGGDVWDELNTEPQLVATGEALLGMIETLSDTEGPVAFDVETYPRDETASSLDPRRGKVGVISLSSASLEHTYVIDRKAFSAEDVLRALNQVLPGRSLIAHNATFDLAFLRRDVGYEHRGPVYDTLVLDAMYFYATGPLAEKDSWRGFIKKDKESGYKKSLSAACEKFLGVTLDKGEQLAAWEGELSEEMVSYAALDTAILIPLKNTLMEELENLGMGRVVEIESRFTPAMAYCADNGFALDVEGWKKHAASAASTLKSAKEKCDQLAPEPPEDMEWAWNASNHRKVGLALEMLGAKVDKSSSTGNYKTDEAALKAIKRPKKAKELAETILEFRAHEKYVTTYGESWFGAPEVAKQGKTKGKIKQGSPGHLMVVEGRVHTQHNQLVATGRGSSKSPNLQNLPSDLRGFFIAPEGRKLLVADYEQMEYVAAAYVSGDEALLAPLREGRDYHALTAEMIGVERPTAKMVNFALLYGMSKKTLAARLGVSEEQAQEYIDAILSRAPGLGSWCDDQAGKAQAGQPYAKTPLGRVRLVDQNYRRYKDAWESNRSQMLNHPIQGGCADGYKLAAALLWERQDEFSGNPLLVNMVHDEFVLEVDEEAAESDAILLEEIMKEGMREVFGDDLPVGVDVTISEKWEKVEYPYVWAWTAKGRPAVGDRKGERCRVLVWGGKNYVLVEFASDGKRVNTSRNALRRAPA